MKIKFIIVRSLLFIFSYSSCFGQGKFGVKYSFKLNSFESLDFESSNFNGHSIVLLYLFFVSDNSDFGIEFDYTYNSLNANRYKDYYNNFIKLNNKITISNSNFEGVYNYYLKKPNLNNFFYGLQAGIGITLGNKWEYKPEPSLFEGASNFKPYYILGITSGTETLRVNLKFNNYFSTYLSQIPIYSQPDTFNRTESRFLTGQNS